MANTFELLPYRFHFRAVDRVRFPAGKAANVFRGALGSILREIACVPECSGASQCRRRSECAYARIFEPSLNRPGPSGFANPPRPFVLRAAHLDGAELPPGSTFHLDVNVFDAAFPVKFWFERTFERLGSSGIGPGRAKVSLEAVDHLGPLAIELDSFPQFVGKLTLQFVTPTELKADGELRNEPIFETLFARIRDRISSLRLIYGPGPLDINWHELTDRAASICISRVCLKLDHSTRRSTRTGEVHPIGGFTGEVDYVGELTEFVPWLECAYWTGVGRQTVWGKGQIQITNSGNSVVRENPYR